MFWILHFYYFHCCWFFAKKLHTYSWLQSTHTPPYIQLTEGYSYSSDQKLETGKDKEWSDCFLEIYSRFVGCHTQPAGNEVASNDESWRFVASSQALAQLPVACSTVKCPPSFPSLAIRLSTRLTILQAMGKAGQGYGNEARRFETNKWSLETGFTWQLIECNCQHCFVVYALQCL